MERSVVAPPVVELGRLVRVDAVAALGARRAPCSRHPARPAGRPCRRHTSGNRRSAEPVVSVRKLQANYDDLIALRGIDLLVRPGEIVA